MAEVLITLGIIGVVAALTMPSLISKHQEKVTVNRLYKAYSIVNNAFILARNDYGDITDWFTESSNTDHDDDGNDTGWNNSAQNNGDLFFQRLSPYLKVVSSCKTTDSNCKKYEYITNLTSKNKNENINKQPILNLADGTTLHGGYVQLGNNCLIKNTYCGDFGIDINGIDKGPNAFGKDIFMFIFTKTSIIPVGHPQDPNGIIFDKFCSTKQNTTAKNNGYACSAWVIINKNMDYLHCSEKLGWNKASRCK